MYYNYKCKNKLYTNKCIYDYITKFKGNNYNMSNYPNLYEAELVDRPREVGTSYKYPSIPLTYRDELKKQGFVQGRRASEWLKDYKGYNIVCLERPSRHSVDVIIKKDKKYLTSKKAYSEDQIWDVITEYENKIDTFRKDPYDRDIIKEDEHIMNIYEQLNKINDNESLSEKYNVKNAKELKKLQESSSVNLRAGRQQKLETFMDYINDKAIELGFDINPATEAHVLTNQRRNIYLSWNYFVGDPQIVFTVSLAKNGGYIVSAALGENWIYPLPSYDFEPSEKSEQEVYEIIDELLSSQIQTKKESLKEESTPYQRIQKVLNNMPDSNPKTMDAAARAIDSKELKEATKQIIADLESKGFVNSDIAAIGTMIKETIDSHYPEYVPPMDRLRKALPDINI